MCIWFAYLTFLTKGRERAFYKVLNMIWLNEILISCHSPVGGKYLMVLPWERYDYTENGLCDIESDKTAISLPKSLSLKVNQESAFYDQKSRVKISVPSE